MDSLWTAERSAWTRPQSPVAVAEVVTAVAEDMEAAAEDTEAAVDMDEAAAAVTGSEWCRSWIVTLPWMIFVALLLISNVATFSWGSLRLRRSWRLFALAGVGLLVAALITEPWLPLLAVSLVYLALIPFSVAAYGRVRRRRAAQA